MQDIEDELVAQDSWENEDGNTHDTPLAIRANAVFNRLLDSGWFRLERHGVEKRLTMRPTVSQSVSSLELGRIVHAVGRDIKSFFAASFVERDALAALFRSDAELAEQSDLLKVLQDSLALGHEMTNLEHLREIDRVQLLTASPTLCFPVMVIRINTPARPEAMVGGA